MKCLYDYIISPVGQRYNNTKKVGDSELVLNTEIFNHQYVNRNAIVKQVPLAIYTPIKIGDEIIVHHNVFRRYHDMKGTERNGRAFLNKDDFIISYDQVFAYKRNNEWYCIDGYCFVQPIKNTNVFSDKKEQPLKGVVIHTDGTVKKNSLVGFKPNSEYEFIIDGIRLYRVKSNFITIKYEYQGDEEKYNPSWAQSGRGTNKSS
jgi:hypothetical protein